MPVTSSHRPLFFSFVAFSRALINTLPVRLRAKSLQSCPTLCDLWATVCQAPLSMGFSRQEYWTGFPCPPPGDLPDPGIEPASLTPTALTSGFFTTSATWEAP